MDESSIAVPRRLEQLMLIAIILIAIVFRFAQFEQVPPGLHYDEAIDAHIAQEIHSGQWSIYYEEGWGREPLYHTFVALTLNLVADPTTALRLVSGALGLIQLLAAYGLFRKLFGVPTALIGAAWIAVMFWTVSTSRAGLRNISLTTFATLTALAFWWAWNRGQAAGHQERTGKKFEAAFILPGVLLGLTLYTYQPSRVVPLIYLILIGFLFFKDRSAVIARRKSLAAFGIVTILIALPLSVFLITHPTAETGRAFQTEPIRALLRGDPSQVIVTALATLKMFTFEGGGDPQILYNLTGRPLFIGLGSILFYLGLIVCLIRWKRPAYAFILIWLIVTLLPNLLTAPAPFFYRAIAAQTPTLALPAIGTVALGSLFNRTRRAGTPQTLFGSLVVVAVALTSLGQTAVTTWQDYFDVWGQNREVRFQYSAAQTEIAHTLDASRDASPVIISGLFTEDSDPYIFSFAGSTRAARWWP
jgi:4-amino-4-deoxy-L-arabinose transferase-like glycosyltransferase